ncbi:isoliquiritigenin 2'-O-methyltransferase-like [Gastrolobium bilobum]|uniref:isoliquiritigenin 2'-O-methyltransferase-like n=1 Tax=Gastrolobium bilobum TaxID=150636 RepID=UPI002AB23EF1|nr:isoliquiritigenin 2'-O-methyltransferase-like [Gastrolobium bilobum]
MDSNWEQNQLPKSSPHIADADDYNACVYAMQLSCSPMMYCAVLNAALELNLFEIIAKATPLGVSASDIASQLPIQHPELPRRLDRMLCLLASHSLLTCSTRTNDNGATERIYQLSLAGKYFVNDENKGTVALFPIFLSHRLIVDAFINFKEVLLDCDSSLFKKIHGMPIYQGIQSDPALDYVFNKAMSNFCTIQMKNILEIYSGFDGISLLVDVGGGIGKNLNMIISKYPSIKGINFDQPQVIENAPTYPGIEQVGGDMFESVPKGDAIILKAVLHNWSDENCLKVLSNCYEALPQNGKVIVVDFIMPETIQSTEADKIVTGVDNLMFLDGGSEKTEKEFENLCKSSGFSNFQVVCCAFSALGVMEFYK